MDNLRNARSIKYLIVLLAALFVSACGLSRGGSSVEVTGTVFEADDIAPCTRIIFPKPVRLDLVQRSASGSESIVRYNLKVQGDPYYDYSLLKIYNSDANAEWALVPLSDQYASDEKLYELINDDYFFERSAVIIFIEKDDGMYLRAIIGEYSESDKAVFFTVDRLIHRNEYMRLFSADEWLGSTSGRFFLDDMIKQTDWYFNNVTITDCRGEDSVKALLSQ